MLDYTDLNSSNNIFNLNATVEPAPISSTPTLSFEQVKATPQPVCLSNELTLTYTLGCTDHIASNVQWMTYFDSPIEFLSIATGHYSGATLELTSTLKTAHTHNSLITLPIGNLPVGTTNHVIQITVSPQSRGFITNHMYLSAENTAGLIHDEQVVFVTVSPEFERVYSGIINSRFEPLTNLYIGRNSSPTLCDIDGDNDPDLFSGKYLNAQEIIHIKNQGSISVPNWSSNSTYIVSTNLDDYVMHLTFADIDDDGDRDLFWGKNVQQTISFAENRGNAYSALWEESFITNNYGDFIVGRYAAPAFCDIDGDDDLDFFAGSSIGTISFCRNIGTKSSAIWDTPDTNYHNINIDFFSKPTFMDIDHDNDYDMFIGTRSNISFIENIGSETSPIWAPTVTNFIDVSMLDDTDFTPCAYDLDYDGLDDLLVGSDKGSIYLWKNISKKLLLTPASITIQQGETVQLSAPGSGTLSWELVFNSSMGYLNTNSGSYVAGPVPGLNVIEVTDVENNIKGRAFVNVVLKPATLSDDRAILISGRNTLHSYDPVWLATDYLANNAYSTLRYLGYAKESIQYVSPLTDRDIDGNGIIDDIDAESTLSNVSYAFTNYAAGASNLFIYLIDHGSSEDGGYMRLSPSEVLSASNLAQQLDDLQNTYHMDITVVLDFCYAGCFLPQLTYTGSANRIIIAATADEQPAYFVAGGLVSFSESFFNSLISGFSIHESFRLAHDAMSDYQSAQLDDTKDGIYDETDGANSGSKIGSEDIVSPDIPQIAQIADDQSLQHTDSALLWGDDVSASYPIDRVWCIIVPPNHNPDPDNPVVDLPEINLSYTDGRYQATYQGFIEPGTYKIIYYAADVLGNVSMPQYGYVNQGGVNEKVILCAGGVTNDTTHSTVSDIANTTYHTFLTRQITASNIYYLNNDLLQTGVDAAASTNTLFESINTWTTNAGKLTLHLIGQSTNRVDGMSTNLCFILSETETITANTLATWLDTWQGSNQTCTIMMDFPGCGQWITNLTAPEGYKRVIIASASRDEPCVWMEEGAWYSFSRIFASFIYRGSTLQEAFSRTRSYIFNLSRTLQDPEMDDNDNGLPNEKSEGERAEQWYIGSAFVTGAEAPVIGSVTEDQLLLYTNTLTLWASEIVAELGVSNVWVTITPPDYETAAQLESMDLTWNASSERYETTYTNFTLPGAYHCTFFAMATDGTISSPMQTEILKADAYETDNTYGSASAFSVCNYQRHNFHESGDEDWAQFFVSTDHVYEVQTVQLGTNVDTVLEIYYQAYPGATPTLVTSRDDQNKGRGDGEYILMDHWNNGWYWAKISPYDDTSTGIGSEYELQVYMPEAGQEKLILIIGDSCNYYSMPAGTVAYVNGTPYTHTNASDNSITIPSLPPGPYTVSVEAPGYIPRESIDIPGEVQNPYSIKFGNPKYITMTEHATVTLGFPLDPIVQVTGTARNTWSGERIEHAQITFEPINTTKQWNHAFNGYPPQSNYKTLWKTGIDGSFPTNVFLPPVDWNVTIDLDGYGTSIWETIIVNPSVGETIDLGALYLQPLDNQNTNGLADKWENIMFGGPVPFSVQDDSDGDGICNWDEYLSGTNPNDDTDAFMFGDNAQEITAQGYTLRWPTVSGHAYRVVKTDALITGNWSLAAGPWTCQSESEMEWTDTNSTVNAGCYYRVEEMRP